MGSLSIASTPNTRTTHALMYARWRHVLHEPVVLGGEDQRGVRAGEAMCLAHVPEVVLVVVHRAHLRAFRYDLTLYRSDGQNGYQDGEPIAWGDNAHSQRLGSGAELCNALVKLCVVFLGEAGTGQYEIIIRLQLEHSQGPVEDFTTFRVSPGLSSGTYNCITLQFR